MVRAVVACVADVVAVAIFLKRIVFVRAVVLVVEFPILITVENDRLADVTFRSARIFIKLVGIGVIRTVVACVADVVAVSVFLKRVIVERTVVFEILKIIEIGIDNRFFANIAFRSTGIAVFLVRVGVSRTVVASITYAVIISIFLVGVRYQRAVVVVIFLSVAVDIDRFGSACKGALVSVRVVWTAVANVANTVVILVFLSGVVIVRAVILEILFAVSVWIDERRFACIADTVSVSIFLIVVRVERTVVAYIAAAVSVTV